MKKKNLMTFKRLNSVKLSTRYIFSLVAVEAFAISSADLYQFLFPQRHEWGFPKSDNF